jgi:hypothetical protein
VTRALPVLALLACSPPSRPPVPDVAGELAREAARVDLLAARMLVDAQLHAQATAHVLDKAQRRSMRIARRNP